MTEDLNPYFTEFVATAKTVFDNADEAAELYAQGDTQAACNAVNVMHYKTGQLEDLRVSLVRRFEKQGITPRLQFDD
jgi:hypothetical protein